MRSWIKAVEIGLSQGKNYVGTIDDVPADQMDLANVWYFRMPHKALLLDLLNRSNVQKNEFQITSFEAFWISHIGRVGFHPSLN